jgi:hypothetical protein
MDTKFSENSKPLYYTECGIGVLILLERSGVQQGAIVVGRVKYHSKNDGTFNK